MVLKWKKNDQQSKHEFTIRILIIVIKYTVHSHNKILKMHEDITEFQKGTHAGVVLSKQLT